MHSVVTASLGSCVVVIPFCRKENGSLRSWETPCPGRPWAVLLGQWEPPETCGPERARRPLGFAGGGEGPPTLNLGKCRWQPSSLHPQAHRGSGSPVPGKHSLLFFEASNAGPSESAAVTWAVFSPVLGQCLQCPAGYFCPNQAAHPIPCQPGTFSPNPGQDETTDCIPCPAGKACTQAGLTRPDAECTPG